jgi:hypothetical protein
MVSAVDEEKDGNSAWCLAASGRRRHALQPRESSSRNMQIQGAGDMQGSPKLLRVFKKCHLWFHNFHVMTDIYIVTKTLAQL